VILIRIAVISALAAVACPFILICTGGVSSLVLLLMNLKATV
jgi:hypothetical protein